MIGFNKNSLFMIGICLFFGLMPAQEVLAQAAGSFARLGFSARGMALSNTLIADTRGDASPYYNPALAPFATRQNLQASVAFMTFDRELQMLQFASHLPPKAGVAIGLIHAGVSDIDGRSSSGYHTGELSTDEFAVSLAFGLKLGQKASIGLGLQIFRADFHEEQDPINTIGIDLGMTLQVTKALRIGIVADDLLAEYLWDSSGISSSQTTDGFPTRLRIGGHYELMDGQLSLFAEYESKVNNYDYRTRTIEEAGLEPVERVNTTALNIQQNLFRVGAEYAIVPAFVLRAGVDRLGDSNGGTRPTAGFKLAQPLGNLMSWFEYAFVLEPYSTGTMHVLTVRFFM